MIQSCTAPPSPPNELHSQHLFIFLQQGPTSSSYGENGPLVEEIFVPQATKKTFVCSFCHFFSNLRNFLKYPEMLLFELFYLRWFVFHQKSPVNPVSEFRGGDPKRDGRRMDRKSCVYYYIPYLSVMLLLIADGWRLNLNTLFHIQQLFCL